MEAPGLLYSRDMVTADTSALEVRRSRGSRVALGVVVAVALTGLAAWFVTHPAAPPTSEADLRASVPAGRSLYLGVYTPSAGSGRTLHLSRVGVRNTGDAVVEALVCRNGALGVTTAPDSFCRSLVPARGTALTTDDQLVLRVTSSSEGTVRVSRPRLTYRDGVQWGTHDAGHRATVTFLAR
jgi:hypothetical protein